MNCRNEWNATDQQPSRKMSFNHSLQWLTRFHPLCLFWPIISGIFDRNDWCSTAINFLQLETIAFFKPSAANSKQSSFSYSDAFWQNICYESNEKLLNDNDKNRNVTKEWGREWAKKRATNANDENEKKKKRRTIWRWTCIQTVINEGMNGIQFWCNRFCICCYESRRRFTHSFICHVLFGCIYSSGPCL